MAFTRFRDRNEAGQHLAKLLSAYENRPDAIVLALPRGGVPVGYEVAAALGIPLDVFVVRKIGVPGRDDLVMGVVGADDLLVLDRRLIGGLHVPEDVVQAIVRRERRELARRELLYRGTRGPLEVEGQTVILVDDGLATGSTMMAALQSLRGRGPESIVVAVPVAAAETCAELRQEADEVVCAETGEEFVAVGLAYEWFPQISDEQVRNDLARAPKRRESWPEDRTPPAPVYPRPGAEPPSSRFGAGR